MTSKEWSNFYLNSQVRTLSFPAEPLVRMMKGSYIPSIDKNYRGKKALDVGFGHGNNLVLLADR